MNLENPMVSAVIRIFNRAELLHNVIESYELAKKYLPKFIKKFSYILIYSQTIFGKNFYGYLYSLLFQLKKK